MWATKRYHEGEVPTSQQQSHPNRDLRDLNLTEASLQSPHPQGYSHQTHLRNGTSPLECPWRESPGALSLSGAFGAKQAKTSTQLMQKPSDARIGIDPHGSVFEHVEAETSGEGRPSTRH